MGVSTDKPKHASSRYEFPNVDHEFVSLKKSNGPPPPQVLSPWVKFAAFYLFGGPTNTRNHQVFFLFHFLSVTIGLLNIKDVLIQVLCDICTGKDFFGTACYCFWVFCTAFKIFHIKTTQFYMALRKAQSGHQPHGCLQSMQTISSYQLALQSGTKKKLNKLHPHKISPTQKECPAQ